MNPWVIIRGNDKKKARLEAMRYVLSKIDYDEKDIENNSFYCDPVILNHYGEN
jgi:hypothetical protein